MVNWPSGVNSKFYAKKEVADDNAVTTEYASGRKSVSLKNTRWPRKYSLSLSLDKRTGEDALFWDWYKDELGGLAGVFKCDALGEGRAWRFSKAAEDGGGTPFCTISLEVEETWG